MPYLKSKDAHKYRTLRNNVPSDADGQLLGLSILSQYVPLDKITCRLGDGSCAQAHASTLKRSTGSRLIRSPQALLNLQRNFGNRFVGRVIGLARKRDQEEDISPESISLQPLDMSRQLNSDREVAAEIERAIDRDRGGGKALDSKVRDQMESAFGVNFSKVRVHTDSKADKLNRALNSRAFTTGKDIFFRQGEYQPGNLSGRKLLAHELTHVCQQNRREIHSKLRVSEPNDIHEKEADQVADEVVQKIDTNSPSGSMGELNDTADLAQMMPQESEEKMYCQMLPPEPDEEIKLKSWSMSEEKDEETPVIMQAKFAPDLRASITASPLIQRRLRQVYFVTDRPREVDSINTVNPAYLNQGYTTPAYLAETRGLAEGRNISITGHASREAPRSLSEGRQREYNRRLSNRRAIAVRNYIQDTGNPPTIRNLEAAGDRGAEADIAYWRRVDIDIQGEGREERSVQRTGCSHPSGTDLSTITAPQLAASGPTIRYTAPSGTFTGRRIQHRVQTNLRRSRLHGSSCECVDVASYRIEIYDIEWNPWTWVRIRMSGRRSCCSTEAGLTVNQACREVSGFSFQDTYSRGENFLFTDPTTKSDHDLLWDIGSAASIIQLVLGVIAFATKL